MQLDLTKRCCRCGESKWRSEFYRNKGRLDGLQTICKDCTKRQNVAYKDQRPGWWRETASYNNLTPEQIERRRLRAQDWHRANPERARENSRRWYWANLEFAREKSRQHQTTRHARKLAVFVEAIDPLVVIERCDGVCGICGRDVDPMSFEVDHIIPLARGGEHSYANAQAAHMACNRRKSAHL
jgi:hypothetical protein